MIIMLLEWTEFNKKISDSQFGFRKVAAEQQIHYLLSSQHDLLWLKLSPWGDVKVVQKHVQMCQTSDFPCRKGVRQSCSLSPLLFSLYISVICMEHILLSQSSGRVRIGEQEITVIMFADDLVLLADSSEGLQQSLTVLYNYCQSWQLEINTTKSKVMILSMSVALQSLEPSFFICVRKVDIVSSFKYLGLVLKIRPEKLFLTCQR